MINKAKEVEKFVEIWHLVYFNTRLVQHLKHTNVFLQLGHNCFKKVWAQPVSQKARVKIEHWRVATTSFDPLQNLPLQTMASGAVGKYQTKFDKYYFSSTII